MINTNLNFYLEKYVMV